MTYAVAVLLALLMLAGCGERARPIDERAAPDLVRPATSVPSQAVPVRIGEAGPSFAACQATGTSRNPAGEPLTVRAGPFDSAAVTGRIPSGAHFFVCTRSIDQRWLGIVFDEAGAQPAAKESAAKEFANASPAKAATAETSLACGVSVPVPRPADYAGPCRQGWAASATVRLSAS